MIRIAVVEDDKAYVEELTRYLHQYQVETGEIIKVTVFADGGEIVEGFEPEYDLILLDIQMKFMDGMTAAEHIRRWDKEVLIIFITNMAQYAIRGYEVNALDFILKPVTYFAFSQKLKRAFGQLRQRERKYMKLKTEDGVIRVTLDEISYIESMKHRVVIHIGDKAYSVVGTMKDMENRLSEAPFFRCNNCYLVNLSRVERVKGQLVMVGGHELQISRPKRKAFMAALTEYMGGTI